MLGHSCCRFVTFLSLALVFFGSEWDVCPDVTSLLGEGGGVSVWEEGRYPLRYYYRIRVCLTYRTATPPPSGAPRVSSPCGGQDRRHGRRDGTEAAGHPEILREPVRSWEIHRGADQRRGCPRWGGATLRGSIIGQTLLSLIDLHVRSKKCTNE